jgi:Uma2 family endonuclease
MHADVAELGFTRVSPSDVDQRMILADITWKQYEALLALFGDERPGIRMAYLEGDLEIMSPSRKHEQIKKTVARLVELYAVERDIDLTGLGSTTFREEAKARGAEPDECYCVGEEKALPDIVFEVIISSGGIDKLRIYEGLGIPELWFWRAGVFHIYRLEPDGYVRRNRSEFLPDIDFARLAELAERTNQAQAVRAFRDHLRGAG